MTVAAVILAGGQGSRLGGNKPLRELGTRRLVDWAVDYAEGISGCRAIAVRDERQVAGVLLPIVHDDPSIEGPLAGLVAALHFAREEGAVAVVSIPVDMPFLPADLGTRLQESRGECRAAIASSGGHLHPVCGLWATNALGVLADYLRSGKRSLIGFAEAAGYVAVDWSINPIDPFFNINSDEDLARAECMLPLQR
jgi:molybdopterin-guanine dinucleotide biosynthesis protein A